MPTAILSAILAAASIAATVTDHNVAGMALGAGAAITGGWVLVHERKRSRR